MTLGPQFEQLKMFMSAREIRDKYQMGNGDQVLRFDEAAKIGPQYTTPEKIKAMDESNWDWKRGITDELHESLLKEGVHNPIRLVNKLGNLGKPQIATGHHRVQHGMDHQPDRLMPVVHYDSFSEVAADKHFGTF